MAWLGQQTLPVGVGEEVIDDQRQIDRQVDLDNRRDRRGEVWSWLLGPTRG